MDRAGVTVARETEQRCASDDVEAGIAESSIEVYGLVREALASRTDPAPIAQRGLTDSQRRPRHWPRSERCGDVSDEIRPSDGKAEPQSGEAKELSERA